MRDLSVKLFGERLKSPLIMASGTFGYGNEYDFIDTTPIAAFVTKGLSIGPKDGNLVPRITETCSGVLNSVGLQNVGIKAFIEDKVPEIKTLPMKIIVNFFGNTEDEYIKAARSLDSVEEVFALEMNVSCPNVNKGGIAFGQDPELIKSLTVKVKKATSKPLIVKLTPNVSSIPDIAKAAENGGANAISLINTVKAMAIDIRTGKPVIGNIMGGLSGKAIKPIAVRAVYEAAKTVSIPVIGMGGISTADDVVEFMMAGASLVQIGSAVFFDPNVCSKIHEGLVRYMTDNKIQGISELTGRSLKYA